MVWHIASFRYRYRPLDCRQAALCSLTSEQSRDARAAHFPPCARFSTGSRLHGSTRISTCSPLYMLASLCARILTWRARLIICGSCFLREAPSPTRGGSSIKRRPQYLHMYGSKVQPPTAVVLDTWWREFWTLADCDQSHHSGITNCKPSYFLA